jgi:hypothetical protein
MSMLLRKSVSVIVDEADRKRMEAVARRVFQLTRPQSESSSIDRKDDRSLPGYVIDHFEPLCAGGADDPSNMQWHPSDPATG